MKKGNPELQSLLIRQLLAAGIRVPCDDYIDWESDLTIEVRNPAQTKGFDFDPDAEFVFDVRITNRSYSPLEIQQIKCSFPWKNAHFMWIRDSLRGWPERRIYGLPSGREFSPEMVLNHRSGKLAYSNQENLWRAFSWPGAWTAGFRPITRMACLFLYNFPRLINTRGSTLQ